MWLLLALSAAFLEAANDLIRKKATQKVDVVLFSCLYRLFGSIMLFSALVFSSWPNIHNKFWSYLIISSLLNACATILYFWSLKHSDISDVVPLISLTPIFLIINGYVILGEIPALSSYLGITLIIIGSIYLALKPKSFKEKQVKSKLAKLAMVTVAVLWSFSSNFDKLGVASSSPLLWSASFDLSIAILLMPVVIYQGSYRVKTTSKAVVIVLAASLILALATICQMTAISLALVSYVISVKRFSIVITVIFGCLLLKESDFQRKIIASSLMIIGVIIIALS